MPHHGINAKHRVALSDVGAERVRGVRVLLLAHGDVKADDKDLVVDQPQSAADRPAKMSEVVALTRAEHASRVREGDGQEPKRARRPPQLRRAPSKLKLSVRRVGASDSPERETAQGHVSAELDPLTSAQDMLVKERSLSTEPASTARTQSPASSRRHHCLWVAFSPHKDHSEPSQLWAARSETSLKTPSVVEGSTSRVSTMTPTWAR